MPWKTDSKMNGVKGEYGGGKESGAEKKLIWPAQRAGQALANKQISVD
jgi:hypothetical protein